MLNRNVVIAIVIAGIICASSYYKTAIADNALLSFPESRDDANGTLPAEITTSIGIKLVLIPAGEYTISYYTNIKTTYAPGVNADNIRDIIADIFTKTAKDMFNIQSFNPIESVSVDTKSRRVIISKPFYIGKYEISQFQWKEIMGNNPSNFTNNLDNPVENITWDAAQEFVRRVNAKEGADIYRLPTAAEWIYAARGGTQTKYYWIDEISEIDKYEWHGNNSGGRTHPVGMKLPNKWGVYDMLGNVHEWVQDWFSDEYYEDASVVIDPEVDPQGTDDGIYHTYCGGAWNVKQIFVDMKYPDFAYFREPKDGTVGFRLAASVD